MKNNEKKLVIKEWQWIYANYNKFDNISLVKAPINVTNTVGVNIGHVKPSNYKKFYNEIIEKERFSILLKDDSVILFYYLCDKSNAIIGQNLIYIPVPNDDNDGTGEESACAKYIRVDYDSLGYKEIIHTKVHLHASVYKTGFRIPIAHFLYPKDFLFFILKYVYHDNNKLLDNLLENKSRQNMLSDLENEKFRIIFGK